MVAWRIVAHVGGDRLASGILGSAMASANPERMRSVNAAAALATAATAVLFAGCAGGHPNRVPDIGKRLLLSGSTWHSLSARERTNMARYCRQAAAVSAGRADRMASAPIYSDSYHAVTAVDLGRLSAALSRWFAMRDHASQTIQQGCTAVAASLAQVRLLANGPYARFAPPLRNGGGILAAHSTASSLDLSARVVPPRARLLVRRALERAPNHIVSRVRRGGSLVNVELERIPLGRSFLRLEVIGDGRSWRRLLVLDRGPAPRGARDRRGLVLRGSGPKVLRSLNIPSGWSAVTTATGAPLTLTSGDALILVHGPADGRTPIPVPAGHYRWVTVAAVGDWTVTLGPSD